MWYNLKSKEKKSHSTFYIFYLVSQNRSDKRQIYVNHFSSSRLFTVRCVIPDFWKLIMKQSEFSVVQFSFKSKVVLFACDFRANLYLAEEAIWKLNAFFMTKVYAKIKAFQWEENPQPGSSINHNYRKQKTRMIMCFITRFLTCVTIQWCVS